MPLLWIAVGMIVLTLILSFSTVQMKCSYRRIPQDHRILVEIKAFFGLFQLRREIPMPQYEELWEDLLDSGKDTAIQIKEMWYSMRKNMQKWKMLLRHVDGFWEWAKASLAYVKCTKLKWETSVGIGDAADTAVAAGILWGIKTNLLGILIQLVRLADQPVIIVAPQYNSSRFYTQFSGSFHIRFGYAMIAGLRLIGRILKVKGGLKVWLRALK